MKFLILFAFLFTLSCSKPDHQSSEIPPIAGGVDLDEVSGSQDAENKPVNVAKSADERDREMNTLKDEEVYLTRQRKREQRRRRGFASRNRSKNSSYTICRRFDGCQRFCSDWMDQNTACNQWTVNTVVQEWSSRLDSLNSEQLIQNAQWMAMHPDVSVFLQEADSNQRVMDKIISRLSMKECPLTKGLNVTVYHHSSSFKKASLRLVHPEGQEQGEKIITDPKYFEVDVYIFKGSVSKCLGEKKFSLSELMLAHQNELGFQLIHQRIADSCGYRDECIQLAYCKIQSDPVWAHLEQVKNLDAFNIDVQADKCSYEDFNSLPSLRL